jgi:hypothetical protein
MLIKIKGVSEHIADIIIAETSILDFDTTSISNLKRSNGRRVGDVIAARVKEHIK